MAGKPSGKGARGVRLNPEQTQRTLAAIQTTQIVRRLNSFALQDENGPVKMSKQQVSAAMGLLRKVLPDLSSVEGNLNHTINHEDALRQMQAEVNGEDHAVN